MQTKTTTSTTGFRTLPAALVKELQIIRAQGNALIESLCTTIQKAMNSVKADWKESNKDERNAIWTHVVREARYILVSKSDGGNAVDGWTLKTFSRRITTIKKALWYGVDIATASKEDMNFLQESYHRASTFAGQGKVVSKAHMERSMSLVRAERDKRTKHIHTSTGYTHYVLPNPGNYEATDGDLLATAGYEVFSAWLDESKSRLKGNSGYEQLFASVRRLVSRFKAENQSLVKGYATDIDTAPVKNGVRTASKPSPAKKGNATPVVAY